MHWGAMWMCIGGLKNAYMVNDAVTLSSGPF